MSFGFFPLQLVRGKRSTISSKATLSTISRALCKNGILTLFAISKLPIAADTDPSVQEVHRREELIEKFKIPHDASMKAFTFLKRNFCDMIMNCQESAYLSSYWRFAVARHHSCTDNVLIFRSLLYEPLLGYGEYNRGRCGLGLSQTHAVGTGLVLARHASDQRNNQKGAGLTYSLYENFLHLYIWSVSLYFLFRG